jgi:hypothetical protein
MRPSGNLRVSSGKIRDTGNALTASNVRSGLLFGKLKECVVLQRKLVERKKYNTGEDGLKKRLAEFVATAESDLKLLREILERI